MRMNDRQAPRRNASAYIRANRHLVDELLVQGYYLHTVAEKLGEQAGFPIGYNTLRSVLSRQKERTAPAAEKTPAAAVRESRSLHQEKSPRSSVPRRVVWNPNPDPKELL